MGKATIYTLKKQKLKRYCLNPQIIISEVAGEMVAVPLVNSVAQMNKVFTLNQTAAFIFQFTKTPKSLEEIVDAIIEEFDIDKETARQDITEILDQGVASNLLTIEEN